MLDLALSQIYTRVFHWWKSIDLEECLGERFSPISTFFSLVSSRAFRDAPYSRFRCGNPNQLLPSFLKMLLLAPPQIYTRVIHLWKSIYLDSTWARDSCPLSTLFSLVSSRAFRDAPHSRSGARVLTIAYISF